ncbi:AAA family ATPase [Porticoccus sp.]
MTHQQKILQLRDFLNNQIVGQPHLVERLIIALLADGHLLVEGAPGLAKTKAIKTLSEGISGDFHRIQFTPDLLPADITGSDIYRPEDGSFQFQPGPIFHNLVLADEINRAPAKVQSALLEAMAERQISVGRSTYPLPKLFLVMATQNPIEQEGTYPLPEAQLDRFMFFIHVDYPSAAEEKQIARETTSKNAPTLEKLIGAEEIKLFQEVVQRVPVPEHIYDAAVEMVRQTRPNSEEAPDFVKQWVSWGAGPRAIQYLIKGAKARAVLKGSYMVRFEDLEAVAQSVLAHRILTNFQAQAEGRTSRTVIESLLELQVKKA